MAAELHATGPTELPEGRFTGREIFMQTVRDALACAAREGWRELILSDADFGDWPLGERAVVEALQAWSRAGRRITLLARDFDEVRRKHARFVAWRQTWAHIIECRMCPTLDVQNFPSLIWSPAWSMLRLDVQRQVIVCEREASSRVALRERIDEILRNSAQGFPVTILGL